jgi:transcriptional regulator with GAF, ATPase, and Fis domain
MPFQQLKKWAGTIPQVWASVQRVPCCLVQNAVARTRLLIVVAAMFVCAYALGVIWHVLTAPDIGIRCAFTTKVNRFFTEFRYPEDQSGATLLPDDDVIALEGKSVQSWPRLLRRLSSLRHRAPAIPVSDRASLAGPGLNRVLLDDQEIIRVTVQRETPRGPKIVSVWCRLGGSPLRNLLPTVLWVFIKAGLFVVGALVFWKRPGEHSARIFFLLCIVSCGAYVGGYHWQNIVTNPWVLLVFLVTSVLLPPVSLHFYLLFPRPKPFFERRPWTTLSLLYGPPLAFILFMLCSYSFVRALLDGPEEINGQALRTMSDLMLQWIYAYFVLALILYLLSLVCLVHSYRNAHGPTERNQVKWILMGAGAALFPIGYSFSLALLYPDTFSRGGATWPMFCASLFVTLAFTISITRYRLMQLDQIVSSGVVYFSISVAAAVVYYGLVFGGFLLLGSRMSGPSLAQVLGVSTTVLVLLVVLDLARGRLKKVLDRHFRREKVQLDRTLQRMSHAIAQMVDPPTLARRLLHSTTDLLGATQGAVYLREGDPALFRLAATLGTPPTQTELLPGCPLVAELSAHGSLYVRAAHTNGAGPGPALRQLQDLGGEAAHALVHEGEILALLLLGPRDSGPYDDEDLNLVAAFAQVTALALVSGESGRTIEILNRELKAKVEKVAEQQRRIIALQSQLTRRQRSEPAVRAEEPPAAEPAPPGGHNVTPPPEPPLATEIVGSSPAVRRLLQVVRKVSGSSSAVLLRGESGTGKELLARTVHENSPRAGRAFVKVHCAALATGLLESELFGHVKGAYTGAVKDRPGRFELAHGGTLFLDEIGDVSWEVQTKLLRVLQEKTFERVGSSEPIQVDVRIIAATHQDLEKLIRQGRFREDLFYRLNVLPIDVPSLRQRREDIQELVQHFLRVYGQRCDRPDITIDDDALTALKAAPWPGNIRQLENAIERGVVIGEGPVLTVEDLSPELSGVLGEELEPEDDIVVEARAATLGIEGERADRDHREREQLMRALAATGGNKAEAARTLGLARSTLISRLKKHGLS